MPAKIVAIKSIKKSNAPLIQTKYLQYALYIEGSRVMTREMTPTIAKLLNRNYERAKLSKVWIAE